MSLSLRWIGTCAAVSGLFAASVRAAAQEPLDADAYVQIVLRSHPAAGQSSGLEAAAAAERRAARLLPDPVLQYSRARASLTERAGARATETGYSLSQTLPWRGTFSAGTRAADRGADVLRAAADVLRWELAAEARRLFAKLVAARALLDVARAGDEDARSLRDLVARRADLGEARESDRIKATVEWLRQQRSLAAAEREADAAEVIVRTLAVEPMGRPLAVKGSTRPPMPALDREALLAEALARSPRLRSARAEAERQLALLSVARRARVPDLDVSVFRDEEADKRATGFSLGVKVPLWNANRGEIAKAQAAAHISSAESERTRVELVSELESRLKDLWIAASQAALLDGELLPAAARSVALARFSFEEGETSLLDLLDAQRTYRDTQREAAEGRLASSVALAEIQRLVGPDFNPWR